MNYILKTKHVEYSAQGTYPKEHLLQSCRGVGKVDMQKGN